MKEEYLDLIDEHDQVIGQAPRSEFITKKLLHRSIVVIVFNSKGEIFVHQRTFDKTVYPGCYDMFVGGGVLAGETYEEAALRELKEELSIKKTKLQPLFKSRFKNKQLNLFFHVFKCVYDGPVKIEKKEIIHGRFMALDELKQLLKKEKFCADAPVLFKKYLEAHHGH